MKILAFIAFLVAPVFAEGPLFQHKDRFVNQEFENVYHDVRTGVTDEQITYLSTATFNTATANFSTTSNSYQTTNLSGTIAPRSTSSRVKISAVGTLTSGTTASSGACLVTLFRGASNLAVGGNLAFHIQEGDTGKSERGYLGLTFIDSPATTSATTYSVRVKNSDSTIICTFGSDQAMILEEIR